MQLDEGRGLWLRPHLTALGGGGWGLETLEGDTGIQLLPLAEEQDSHLGLIPGQAPPLSCSIPQPAQQAGLPHTPGTFCN